MVHVTCSSSCHLSAFCEAPTEAGASLIRTVLEETILLCHSGSRLQSGMNAEQCCNWKRGI
jgi:hypothetical protein